MKVSILGPTNIEKFSKIVGISLEETKKISKELGKIIAKSNHEIVVVFNYSGMLRLIGDSYKENEGEKLTMLYTENDYDWDVNCYMDNLKEANNKIRKQSWHDMLLSLIKDSDVVVCAGLSAGGLVELGYMKWNKQEGKGKVKTLIGIKEFLRDGKFPPEIEFDLRDIIKICSVSELGKVLNKK